MVELATFILRQDAAAADRFMDACEATFQFVADWPQTGSFYPTNNSRLSGLRVFRVKGFPNHLVFYLEHRNGIDIVRVVHGARDLDVALEEE